MKLFKLSCKMRTDSYSRSEASYYMLGQLTSTELILHLKISSSSLMNHILSELWSSVLEIYTLNFHPLNSLYQGEMEHVSQTLSHPWNMFPFLWLFRWLYKRVQKSEVVHQQCPTSMLPPTSHILSAILPYYLLTKWLKFHCRDNVHVWGAAFLRKEKDLLA